MWCWNNPSFVLATLIILVPLELYEVALLVPNPPPPAKSTTDTDTPTLSYG